MQHLPQGKHDAICILGPFYAPIAVGYKCGRCGKSVYPLGSNHLHEFLTLQEQKILEEGRIDGKCQHQDRGEDSKEVR